MALNFTFGLSLDPGINLLFFPAASAHLGMSVATVCGAILFAEFCIPLKQESTSHYIRHILNKGWCGPSQAHTEPVRHGGNGGEMAGKLYIQGIVTLSPGMRHLTLQPQLHVLFVLKIVKRTRE